MLRRTLAAAAASLLVGACGGDPAKVDAASVEEAIRADVTRQGGALATIECPQGVRAEPGQTFDCSITLADGDDAVAHVTMTTRDRFDFRTERVSAP